MNQVVYSLECITDLDRSFFVLRKFDAPGEQPKPVACGNFEDIARYFGVKP